MTIFEFVKWAFVVLFVVGFGSAVLAGIYEAIYKWWKGLHK